VGSGGTFAMSGGTITDNHAIGPNSNGGGVDVRTGSAFTMSGGVITGNTATSDNRNNPGGGGGVCVGGGSNTQTFIMQGGTISGNSAIGTTQGGGGVKVETSGGVFIMEGGTIYGNDSRAKASGNANDVRDGSGAQITGRGAAIMKLVGARAARWGTGGTYTKGDIPQTDGSEIGNTDDTLIAIPAR